MIGIVLSALGFFLLGFFIAALAYRAGIRAGVAMSIVAMRHSAAPLTQAPPTETRH